MNSSNTPASKDYNTNKRKEFHYVDTECSTGFTMQFRAITNITEISSSSKLLFAEIFALTQQIGYCFAKTSYFSKQLGLSERQILRCLTQLEKYGLIIRVRTTFANNKTQRKIYINMDLFEQIINTKQKDVYTEEDEDYFIHSEQNIIEFTEEEINSEQQRLLNRIKSIKRNVNK